MNLEIEEYEKKVRKLHQEKEEIKADNVTLEINFQKKVKDLRSQVIGLKNEIGQIVENQNNSTQSQHEFEDINLTQNDGDYDIMITKSLSP